MSVSASAADLPDLLLPYQQRFWRLVDKSRVTVAEKGRRIGFTKTLGAVAAGTTSADRTAHGSDVIYMGYDKEMAREFIDYVAEWAAVMQLAASAVEETVWTDPDDPDKDIQTFRIRFASGFEVMTLPCVARALRGKQGLVILDEAAFMDDLAEVLKAALATLMWGGKVIVSSTHNGDTNPFNLLVQDIRAGRKSCALMRVTFDEAIAEGLYRRICLVNGETWSAEGERAWRAQIVAEYGDDADEELFVIPSPTGGAYIPGALIEARQRDGIPVLRLERTGQWGLQAEHLRKADIDDWLDEHVLPVLSTLDPKTPHAFGWDFARSGDLSVLMPVAIGADIVRRVPFMIEIHNLPFANQRQVLWFVIRRLPLLRKGLMDAGGNGSQIAEETVQEFGAVIEAIMLTEPWYRENMPALKGAFEDGTIEIPRDRETGDDFRMLRIIRGVGRVPPSRRDDKGKKRHGDAAIAGVLAIAASRADPEVYAYQGGLARRDGQRRWTDQAPEDDDDIGMAVPGRGFVPALRGGMLS